MMVNTNQKQDEILNSIYKKDSTTLISLIEDNNVLNYQDKDGRTVLFYAILEKDVEIVKILLDAGAEINLKDNNGWHPLHYAVNEHLPEICHLLIDNGSHINAVDQYGNTVIWRGVFASKGRGDIIKLLLLNGADPTIENNSGVSALSLAKNIGNYNIQQFFQS